MALSSIEAEFIAEFLHCVNREFRLFLRKIVENIKFSSCTAKLMQTMLKHIYDPLSTVLAVYALPELHAFKVLFYAESVGVVTSGHVTKVAVTSFDPQLPKTPCYTQTSPLYLLWNLSYCRLKFYIAGIGNFAYFLPKIEEILYFPLVPQN